MIEYGISKGYEKTPPIIEVQKLTSQEKKWSPSPFPHVCWPSKVFFSQSVFYPSV